MLFMGPSGSGKSTIVGQILLCLGLVSIEELQENEALAIADDRQGRQLAYIIDNKEDDHRLNDEMQLGNASFEIKRQNLYCFGCTGSESLVPKMIKGAYEADLGIPARMLPSYQCRDSMEDNIEMCRSGTVRSLFDVLEAMDLCSERGCFCAIQERPKVVALYCIKGKIEVDQAGPGDYVSIHIVPPHNDIHPGAVLSSGGALSRTKSFTAELRFLKTPARMYNGFNAMLHIHSLEVHNCEIVEMKKFTNGSWVRKKAFCERRGILLSAV
ncbi:eukaryotic peptide chain release factor GTP-binding subunit ERF3B-like isoform X2 [Raphanus sativus]|nr:eukaryotic peptide chain release factor GTP-binding subunit ERF3B-like isoform X2 [Raphanus sativus]